MIKTEVSHTLKVDAIAQPRSGEFTSIFISLKMLKAAIREVINKSINKMFIFKKPVNKCRKEK